jgi:hypothetical protein
MDAEVVAIYMLDDVVIPLLIVCFFCKFMSNRVGVSIYLPRAAIYCRIFKIFYL